MFEFDDTTRFFDRSDDEVWRHYDDSHQRAMRNAIVGCSPAAYDEQFQPKSYYITRSQFYSVHQAVTFANYKGFIFTVNLTIAWAMMGYRYGQEVDEVHRLLMQAIRKYMRRHGAPNLNYTVFERSETFGLHAHAGVHVPKFLYPQFKKWLVRRIARLDLVGYRRRLHVRHRRETATNRAIEEQWRWFRYCMKGVNPDLNADERDINGLGDTDTFASYYGLRPRSTGIVTLNRVRTSQDMLKKARRESDYPENYYLIDREDRYTDSEYRRGKADRLTEMLQRDLP